MSGYDIAVKISLIENVNRGLTAMSGAFAKTGKDAEALEKKLASIGKMTMAGGALLGAGLVGMKGLEATVEAASKYQKAVADFKTLNLSAHEVAEVEAKAAENAHKVLGSTLTENVKTVQDLHTAFGDLHHALEFSTDFTKFEMVMKQSLGEGKAGGQVMAAAKALEHRGDGVLQNTAEFQDELNRIAKVSLATKGVVTAKDFLQASNTGKMAYTLLDKDYLYGKGAAMMTMNGGDKFGTMLMTAFSSLIGGHMDKKAKGFLSDIDMFEEGVSAKRMKSIKESMKGMSGQEKQIFMQQLGGESMMAGGLKAEYVDLMKSPDKLAAVMANKIRERYGKDLNNEQVAEIIAKNFNRNTGMFLGEHVLNAGKLDKDGKIFENAQGYQEAYDTYSKTQDGASLAMHGEWENLKTVLGTQLLPIVTSITQGITSLVTSMREFAQANPEITKFIMIFAGALTVITLVAGVALLATAAFSALGLIVGIVGAPVLLIVGLFAALVAIGYMVYDAWQKADIKGYWKDVASQWDGLKNTVLRKCDEIMLNASKRWDNIKKSVSTKIDQIKTAVQQKWEAIKQAVSQKIEQVKTTIQQKWELIKATVQQKMQVIWTTIQTTWNNIVNTVRTQVNNALGAVDGGFSSIYSSIANWISQAVNTVSNAVGGALSGIAEKAHNFFSRASYSGGSGINTIAKGGKPQLVAGHVYLNQHKVGTLLTSYQTKESYRGAGGRNFDGSRGRVMV